MHFAYSSTNISQVLLNVESTFEIKIVLMPKMEPLTKQEHRCRKPKPASMKKMTQFYRGTVNIR